MRRGCTRFLAALAALALAGCGRVDFVPSPYTPQSIEIVWAPAENLTVLKWSVNTVDLSQAHFELAAGDGTFRAVDFSAAPYPSGTYACDKGTCGQLVMRGHYRVPPGLISPLRTMHDRYGPFPGTPWMESMVDPTLTATAGFPEGNATIAVTAADQLLGPPMARKLGWVAWPLPTGDCGQPPTDALSGPLTTNKQSIAAPNPLDDSGRYCVGVRGLPQDSGDAPAFSTVALTFPSTSRQDFDYKPVAEQTPLLVQLIVDLETADPSRCNAIHQTLLTTLRGAFAAAQGNYHEFALVDLAPTCQQDANRTFDAAQMADGIKQWVHTNETVVQNRVVLFYANNLSTPVPPQLQQALVELPSDIANDPRVGTWFWGMVADGATPGVTFDLMQPWTAIEDPGFARAIAMAVQQNLAFETQLHDDTTPVPLLDGSQLLSETGNLLKLCEASGGDGPATLTEGAMPASDVFVTITPASPPGFLVALASQITVPRSAFVQRDVVGRFEICRRFCDHPYTNDAGLQLSSWKGSTECVHNHSP